MSTKAVLDNLKASLEASLNPALTDKGLVPVSKFLIGNLKTRVNPALSLWSPSTEPNEDLDDEISILVTLRLGGEQDEEIYDYSDLLVWTLRKNLDAGGELDEGDVVSTERYHAGEKSNPTIFIELSGRVSNHIQGGYQ